jgi:hypothetical protein
MKPDKTLFPAIQNKDWLFSALIVAIIGMGLILRTAKYLPGWSMRGDELAVALNLINRSAIELITRPLDGDQAAPMGFLLVEKLLIALFGKSEYILRLPAFVAGCASLILLQKLLTKTVGKYGNLFAMAASAFGWYLIYYSSELKQYSSDVLVCIVLLLFFQKHLSKETTRKDFIGLGIAGALSIFFSHPALFVVMAIGMTLFIHYWKDRQRLIWTIITGGIWSSVFLTIYLTLLQYQTSNEFLITFWRNLLSYMPMPPWEDISWYPKALSGLLFVVGGLSSTLIFVGIIYIFGLWMFLSEKKWQWVCVLTLPIAINMGASGFQKFPFHGQLILYLLPLVFMVIGKGIDGIVDRIGNRAMANIAFASMVILLLRPAVPTTSDFLFSRDYVVDDLKPVLTYMEDNTQTDDHVYLYHSVSAAFEHYAPLYNLEILPVIYGENNSQRAKRYDDELSSLPRGKRIWFVFSFIGETRINKETKQNERDYILNYMKGHGTLIREYYSTNNVSSAHLFILDR